MNSNRVGLVNNNQKLTIYPFLTVSVCVFPRLWKRAIYVRGNSVRRPAEGKALGRELSISLGERRCTNHHYMSRLRCSLFIHSSTKCCSRSPILAYQKRCPRRVCSSRKESGERCRQIDDSI